MKCWLVIYFLYTLHYTFAKKASYEDLKENEDYSSGDRDRIPHPLIGNETETRPLMAGDTFTPQDMLPIAEKLLKKVEEPGSGKGFVSSMKVPQELADKLFEAFFHTEKRIITLKNTDISGLDALQALAIEGDVADNTLVEESTEPAQKYYLRAQIIDVEKPIRSHYKLVTKTVPQNVSKKNVTKGKGKRRGIPLSKKLPPKRHLVVNEPAKQRADGNKNTNNKGHKKIKRKGPKINKNIKTEQRVRKSPKPERKAPKCRWNYVCTNQADLDTCRVHTSCVSDEPLMNDYKKQKEAKAIEEFRRMVRISAVDEEVEKILEVRNVKIRPLNSEMMDRVESLSEFFNKIVERENAASTTPIEPDRDEEN